MDVKDKEYDFLRKEIEFYLAKQNLMINWLYISVTAILALALDTQNVSICTLIYCIIIPTFFVEQEYNISMLKIGAYLNVFYDDYKWEKRLHLVNKRVSNEKKINRLSFSHNIPYIFMGLLSCILAWIININIKIEDFAEKSRGLIYCIIISIITIVFITFVVIQKNNDKIKNIYIEEWKKICSEEDNL